MKRNIVTVLYGKNISLRRYNLIDNEDMTYFSAKSRSTCRAIIAVCTGESHPFPAFEGTEIHTLQPLACSFNLREGLYEIRHRNSAKIIVRHRCRRLAHVTQPQNTLTIRIQVALHARVNP